MFKQDLKEGQMVVLANKEIGTIRIVPIECPVGTELRSIIELDREIPTMLDLYYDNNLNHIFDKKLNVVGVVSDKKLTKNDLKDGMVLLLKNNMIVEYCQGCIKFKDLVSIPAKIDKDELINLTTDVLHIRAYDESLIHYADNGFSIVGEILYFKDPDNKVTISSLEDAIFRLEEIRVVIRAAKYIAKVDSYDYKRKAPGDMKVKEWIKTRIKPILEDIEIEIINGNGQIQLNANNTMEDIRSSYKLD